MALSLKEALKKFKDWFIGDIKNIGVGDGTCAGAISELNSKLEHKMLNVDTCKAGTTIDISKILAGMSDYGLITFHFRRWSSCGSLTIGKWEITNNQCSNGTKVTFGGNADMYANFNISTTGIVTFVAVNPDSINTDIYYSSI